MKKIIYSLTASLALIATAQSCDSILDKAPLDSFADANYWTSESNVEVYANTFFNNFVGYGNGGGSGSY